MRSIPRSLTASLGSLLVLTLAGSARAQDEAAPPPPVAPAQPAPAPAPTAVAADSEERTAENSIFGELLGNGGLYSINYERLFGDSGFSARIGFSYFSVSASSGSDSASASLMTFPLLANYYLGGANHKLQLGAGATFFYASAASSTINATGSASGFVPVGTLVVGYRYIPHDGGFNFGVGFTPLFGVGGFLPWGGVSFGGGF